MARKVFYSFCYEDDINRIMMIRNHWIINEEQNIFGVISKAEFEKINKNGRQKVYDWIDKQLEDTSVTVVLIGSNTLNREFVKYEIQKSIQQGNAIIGVYIHNIKDMLTLSTSIKGNVHTSIGYNDDGSPMYFDQICNNIYDYVEDEGYMNLGIWIENALNKKGKYVHWL